MIAMSPVRTDARVRREAETLAGAGWSVDVVGLGSGLDPLPNASGVRYTLLDAGRGLSSDTTRRLQGTAVLAPAVAVVRRALLPRHRRARTARFLRAAGVRCVGPYDVVHAHDFPTLAFAHNLAARWNARVVYDAHEWWSGRRREERPTPMEDARTRGLERRLGGSADAVLTVSGAIVERMRHTYGWQHVTLVRNTFPAAERRPVPAAPSGLLYAGRIGAGRDLATVAAAAAALRPLGVTLVGPVDEKFVNGLDLSSVRVAPALPIDDVDGELLRHGLALVTLEDGWDNHRMAQPNKLFQAVRAGVPVVASDLPELRRVVTGYGLGTLYRPGSTESLTTAVKTAVDGYADLLANVRRARAAFDWRVDAGRLLAVYRSFAPAGEPLHR